MVRRLLLAARGLLLLAPLGACTAQDPADLPFRTGTIERHPDGTIAKAKLVEPTVFQDLPCRDWVRFLPDGRLAGAELAVAAEVAGHLLPAGTHLWYADEGWLESAWLGADVTLDGILCYGGGKAQATFWPDGALRAAFLVEDTVIDGVPCAASPFHPFRLDPAGRLMACRVARSCTVDGRTYRRGEDFERRE